MITFEPLFKTLSKRGKSTQSLVKDRIVGGGTLQRLRDGNGVSTDTVNALCNYLRCKPVDIIRYTPDQSDGPGETTDGE